MLRRFSFDRGRRRLLSALAGFVLLAGCGGEIGEPTGNIDTVGTPDPLHTNTNDGDRDGDDDMPESKPPIATPSGYLLLSAERLDELKTMVASSDPSWLAFKDYVDGRLDELSIYNDSPENRALMYLLTGEQLYADAAWDFASELMSSENVRFDSYLHFGDLMRHAAIVLSYCDEALSSSQRDALIAYLDTWTNELWFNNQGSGWGLADPGNNYHLAFLEGTAYAGYALQSAGVANGQVYVDLLLDKLEKDGGVLDYLEHVNGGGWFEGTNYGERSKQRLNGALSVVASMGGTNHFYEHPYLAGSVRYAVYELQPDGVALYPGGDLARDSAMPVSPSERDYLLVARFWLGQGVAPSLATWYVDNVATTFDLPAYRHLMFKNMVFGSATPAVAPSTQPLGYHAEGTGFINLRSGWSADATSISISAPSYIEQSHQHIDAGSFVLFKNDWLALDATSLSPAGLNWSPCAHNGICVPGAEHRDGAVGGVTGFMDDGQTAYVGVDATDQYRHRPNVDIVTMMNEHTRELVYLRPGVLVVYDRVVPKNSQSYEWRMHLPAPPTQVGNTWQLAHAGAGITLKPIKGQVVGVASDSDLSDGASSAWRVVAVPSTPAQGRLLNVIATANGAAPSLSASAVTTSSAIDGVALADAAVVFSSNAMGAPVSLPFSYTVSGAQTRLHVIANLTQSVDVSATTQGDQKTITVSAGTQHAPNAGTITVSL